MKTGIVVGAGGGIGAACVRALSGSADLTVLVGRRPEPLESIAREIESPVTVVPADVATARGRDAIVAAVDGELGWVVLASGVPVRRPLAALEEEEIEHAFAANVVGPTLLLRRLLHLPWSKPKAIVVIGSISASRTLPDRSVYSASKAGIEHLARSLSTEVAGCGIRVNVVAPGVIETPFLGDAREALDAWVETHVPLGRCGTADEVASAVRYLILEAPGYLTGTRMAVDGAAEALA